MPAPQSHAHKLSKHSHTYLAVSVLLAAAGSAGCGTTERAAAAVVVDPEVDVAVARAERVEVPTVLELDGTLRAKRSARVSPLVSGHVARVLVERGAVVEEGQTLIELRATTLALDARAAAARATAQLEQLGVAPGAQRDVDPDSVPGVAAAKADWDAARDQLERNAELHEMGAISDQVIEQTRAAEAAARARYDAARQGVNASLASYSALSAEASRRREDASNTRIRAPFAGSVVQRMAEVGEFVGPQSPVLELVDASELRLELEVPERSSTRIAAGQAVSVTVDGVEGEIAGTVRFVSAALDEQRRTLTIEAVVPNPDGRLRAGHFARARIALGGTEALVRVPAGAVRERAGVERIFVIEDGVARARIVSTVRRDGDAALISGDLREGESVVLEPPHALADGATVRVVTPVAER